MESNYQMAGLVLTVILYGILSYKIINHGTKQSLATWGLLDVITCISIYQQNGNWMILGLFCLGSTFICLLLAWKRQFTWGWFENFIAGLVLACLAIWYYVGPELTTIAGTTSAALATATQIKDSWKNPDKTTVIIWIGFTIVNFCYFMAGKTWEIKDTLYPVTATLICTALIIANIRIKDSKALT